LIDHEDYSCPPSDTSSGGSGNENRDSESKRDNDNSNSDGCDPNIASCPHTQITCDPFFASCPAGSVPPADCDPDYQTCPILTGRTDIFNREYMQLNGYRLVVETPELEFWTHPTKRGIMLYKIEEVPPLPNPPKEPATTQPQEPATTQPQEPATTQPQELPFSNVCSPTCNTQDLQAERDHLENLIDDLWSTTASPKYPEKYNEFWRSYLQWQDHLSKSDGVISDGDFKEMKQWRDNVFPRLFDGLP
jgi:hypothetical protein